MSLRHVLGVAGVAAAVAAIAINDRRVTWAAIALLGGSVALRAAAALAARRRERAEARGAPLE